MVMPEHFALLLFSSSSLIPLLSSPVRDTFSHFIKLTTFQAIVRKRIDFSVFLIHFFFLVGDFFFPLISSIDRNPSPLYHPNACFFFSLFFRTFTCSRRCMKCRSFFLQYNAKQSKLFHSYVHCISFFVWLFFDFEHNGYLNRCQT